MHMCVSARESARVCGEGGMPEGGQGGGGSCSTGGKWGGRCSCARMLVCVYV